jgi:hypothetical protein
VRQLITTPPSAGSDDPSTRTAVLRWLVTFAGFPLGGVAASSLTGPVDDSAPAVLGGLVTGLVLGAVQAWGLGVDRRSAVRWTLATSAGFALGLGLGATAVGFATSAAALVVQGAVCGVAVGAAQAVALSRRPAAGARLRRATLAWPLALGVIWALGWAITTAVGVQVGEQFTVFGSSGAIVVTALTLVLPLGLRTGLRAGLRPGRGEERTS